MSITVENERYTKVHHIIPLCINEIFHNQVTTFNVTNWFFKKSYNAKLYHSKYSGPFPSELSFLYFKIYDRKP